MKYNVGDKVLIRSDKLGDYANERGGMDKWMGKHMTIRAIHSDYGYRMIEDIGENSGDGWVWHDHMIERRIDMFSKSDLKTGMWIETKRGEKGMVLLGTKHGDIVSGPALWDCLDSWSGDLKYPGCPKSEIVKVCQPTHNRGFYSAEDMQLIWERKEDPIEITAAEAIKICAENKGVSTDRIRIKE